MCAKQDIASDMASNFRLAKEKRDEEIAFYLVTSNRELLVHIEKMMNRYGAFGVLDSSGRVHYLIDARRGVPLAKQKFSHVVTHLIEDRLNDSIAVHNEKHRAVTSVLGRFAFNRQLRGYRILLYMLTQTIDDESLLDPVSKRLFPLAGEVFDISSAQVERNVRYLFEDLRRRERSQTDYATAKGARRYLSRPQASLPVAKTLVKLTDFCRAELSAMQKTPSQ